MSEDEEVVINTNTSLLIETVENRWKTYRSELKRCRSEPSEEGIHDLRVATRRLLALVDMLRKISPHPRLQKLRRTFKNQLDDLDELRDTQVMLVDVSEALGELPELAPFQKFLSKREKRLLKSTAKGIKSFKTTSVRKRLDSTRKELLKLEDKNQDGKALLQIVDDAYETTLRRFQRIEPTQSGTIHRVRIAFKKFRYMVEIIHPLIPGFPDGNFKQMHEYQGMMGDIHDLEIFVSTFNDFAGNDGPRGPEPVQRFYERRHTEAMNTFLEDMHQINTFWRPAPESPFPWEIGEQLEKSALTHTPVEPLLEQETNENGKQIEGKEEAQK
jgi:CHAD domain-containing protein